MHHTSLGLSWWLAVMPLTDVAQQHVQTSAPEPDVMLAAVSRDRSMLSGGIGSGARTAPGRVVVEPLARLSPTGNWRNVPCVAGDNEGCRQFAREYLSKPHSYTVISGDGSGAFIRAKPTTLSECYDFAGDGTYSGASLAGSAIAASSEEFFAGAPPLRPVEKDGRALLKRAVAGLIPRTLDSTRDLRFFDLSIEGYQMVVMQRAYADMSGIPDSEGPKHVFAIGRVSGGRFEMLHWKKNTEDEDERVIGTIRLSSGREFLISVVNDPESHWFRVYGIRGGRLALVYSGGGSSC